jgi:hypothetical protein
MSANYWEQHDALVAQAERLVLIAQNLAAMVERGQDGLALAAALDARLEAGLAVTLARDLAGSSR